MKFTDILPTGRRQQCEEVKEKYDSIQKAIGILTNLQNDYSFQKFSELQEIPDIARGFHLRSLVAVGLVKWKNKLSYAPYFIDFHEHLVSITRKALIFVLSSSAGGVFSWLDYEKQAKTCLVIAISSLVGLMINLISSVFEKNKFIKSSSDLIKIIGEEKYNELLKSYFDNRKNICYDIHKHLGAFPPILNNISKKDVTKLKHILKLTGLDEKFESSIKHLNDILEDLLTRA